MKFEDYSAEDNSPPRTFSYPQNSLFLALMSSHLNEDMVKKVYILFTATAVPPFFPYQRDKKRKGILLLLLFQTLQCSEQGRRILYYCIMKK